MPNTSKRVIYVTATVVCNDVADYCRVGAGLLATGLEFRTDSEHGTYEPLPGQKDDMKWVVGDDKMYQRRPKGRRKRAA